MIALLIIALVIMVFYQTMEELFFLVTGVNRIIFTACCFMICISFYKVNYKLPDFIHKPLKLVGEASYSVYLLLPITYNLVDLAEYKLRNHILLLSKIGKSP